MSKNAVFYIIINQTKKGDYVTKKKNNTIAVYLSDKAIVYLQQLKFIDKRNKSSNSSYGRNVSSFISEAICCYVETNGKLDKKKILRNCLCNELLNTQKIRDDAEKKMLSIEMELKKLDDSGLQ